ncbi:sucrose phosphorylase [Shewanella surugensis]|uniref:Sucrose phosphorylase n=1 Tax=Shewanella surugensis TaxID=212020 RepID=A0ABT0L9K6_9GAMM|nr:sucrose phosphorylase [Shewanella surugensis]MCL1124032.1 sucrose phosphorylase [Shewanella surugensis]
MKNKIQLITYTDRMTGGGLKNLKKILDNELKNVFSGAHILPFYYPIDGSDAGFDPIDHIRVDPRLGEWNDIKNIGQDYDLMADLIVNHISAESEEFQDVLRHPNSSPYRDLFLTKQSVFPEGMTAEQQQSIYRPRPGSCFSRYTLDDGSEADFWTTFTRNQIDIDVKSHSGQAYLNKALQQFAQSNIKLIRLDAAGYAIKKAGSSCFMIKEAFDFIDELSDKAHQLGMRTLAEIHSHYETQIDIAKRVDMVYDFALPPLILHTLNTSNCDALCHWLTIAPRNCVTVLDTHDGIGIIDVGPSESKRGLLTADQIDTLVNSIHTKSAGESLQATGSAANNIDLYQINCTYYDALGQNNYDYLLARAIQFFSPGIPQVYYAGLLAIPNDMALLEKTHVGRDINRPYLNHLDIRNALKKPIVDALIKLIKIRNNSEAFEGDFSLVRTQSGFNLCWNNLALQASLNVDLMNKNTTIFIKEAKKETKVLISDLLVH